MGWPDVRAAQARWWIRVSKVTRQRWTASTWRVGRPKRRGRSSGQALVEFALVIIPFFLIFFSVVEFALIVASIGTYNFAARDAARIGSILGRQKTTSVVDGKIVSDVQSHAQGFVMATAQEMDIYRAAADGNCLNAPTGSASEVSVDDPTCKVNKYNIDGTLMAGTSVQWPTNDRNDSLQSGDYLGVRVLYRYTALTGFIAAIGSTLNLSSTSVQRIEPQQFTGYHSSFGAAAAVAAPLCWLTRAIDLVLWQPTWDRWALERP
jgi:Flp pilus assembly protein TadG